MDEKDQNGYPDENVKWDWLGVVASIKTILRCEDNCSTWRYDEKVFGWGLNTLQIEKLTEVVRALTFNCTSRHRQVIKGVTRFGQFYHICLQFPDGHGKHDFAYCNPFVKKYKDIISKLIEGLFPEYTIGYFIKASRQQADRRMPETHYHIVLSSIRYRKDDKSYLNIWNKLPEDTKPYHALWFLTDPIILSEFELATLIKEKWRVAIEKDTGREISRDQEPLVCVTGYEAQKYEDRFRLAHYIANQALHTFRNFKNITLAKDDKVISKYKTESSKPMVMFQRDFVIKYPSTSPVRRQCGMGRLVCALMACCGVRGRAEGHAGGWRGIGGRHRPKRLYSPYTGQCQASSTI